MKIHTEAWRRHKPTHHKDTHRSTMQTHAHPSWRIRILHTEAWCRHMCLGCESCWPYTWLSTPISVSVDIVSYIGTTQDCQHRFLSLWILWSIVTSSQQRMTKINSTSSHAATSQSENKISSHRALQVLTVLQRPTGLEIRSNQSILSVNRIFSGSSFSLHLASINERNSSHTDMPQYWAHHLYCISHAIQTWQSHTHTQNGANSTQWLH